MCNVRLSVGRFSLDWRRVFERVGVSLCVFTSYLEVECLFSKWGRVGGTTGSVQSVEVVPVSGVRTGPLGMVSSTLPSYLGRLQPTLPTWRFCVF